MHRAVNMTNITLVSAGSGPNGAIVHYRAEAATCSTVDDKQLFLLDSGAQFVDGTTDITRTVHFGTPSDRQKECFTRVLQVANFSVNLYSPHGCSW